MDTNQNIHVNSFVKGMNSDTSYDMIGADQYLFGQNIRITNNTLIAQAANANTTEGIVTPVPEGKDISVGETEEVDGKILTYNIIDGYDKILATASIGDTGAIIVANDETWDVYKVTLTEGIIKPKLVFSSGEPPKERVDRFSVVLNKETEDLLKLYIADGKHPVMQVLLKEEYYDNLEAKIDNGYSVCDCLSSNRLFPYTKPILSKISGQLKTQQLQYTYRLYHKYGITSRLSPLTNKIQVITSNRNTEIGNAEDTTTNVGFNITITCDDFFSSVFDHIQLFRISYIKQNQQPEINLIFDKPFSGKEINIKDDGLPSLAQYTVDEFSALSSQTIIPKTIEQNNQYLFAGNTDDQTILGYNDNKFDTIIKNAVQNTKHSLVSCDILLDDSGYNNKPDIKNPTNLQQPLFKFVEENSSYSRQSISDYNIDSYFKECGIDYSEGVLYDEIFTSSLLRSLRRDEDYRYGIVYYDIYGRHSSVYTLPLGINEDKLLGPFFLSKTVLDSALDKGMDFVKLFESKVLMYLFEDAAKMKAKQLFNVDERKFIYSEVCKKFEVEGLKVNRDAYHKVFANPIGIRFTIQNPNIENIIGYQIVRCQKTDDYLKNLMQVALSRPMRQGKYGKDEYRTPYYPNVYLSTNFFYTAYGKTYNTNADNAGKTTNGDIWLQYFDKSGTNVENTTLYQAFSPEINIQRQNSLAQIKSGNSELQSLWYQCEGRDVSLSVAQLEYNDVKSPQTDIIKYAYTANGIVTKEDYFARYLQYSDMQIVDDTAHITISPGNSGTQDGGLQFQTVILIPSGYSVTGDTGVYLRVAEKTLSWSEYMYKEFNANIDGVDYIVYVSKDAYKEQQEVDIYVEQQIKGECLKEIRNELEWSSSLEQNDYYVHPVTAGVYISVKYQQNVRKAYKSEQTAVMKLYKPGEWCFSTLSIKNSEDVKNPNQEDGFSNIQLNGSDIVGIIKQYKSYSTSIGGLQYVNWVANGMYDLAAIKNEVSNQPGNNNNKLRVYTYPINNETDEYSSRAVGAHGWIGPGPVCLLLNTEQPNTASKFCSQIGTGDEKGIGTLVANIRHETLNYDDYSPYYGFGNFRTFDENSNNSECTIFDGDVYITLAEFVNMFKTYDFNDISTTLDSGQMIYYIPLESRINTCFDYGYNYRNTNSKNLLLEPGQISGICSQDRPLHQYNMVYSDNYNSNDVFYIDIEKQNPSITSQRICYSQLKTNGENIDNWQIFKPADYIDADTRYGAITNLLTSNDTLYFWQEQAFGKLSVNERSLVTDENSNVIQLGQGGVLQRTDYLSTHYGMRDKDYAAIAAENGIYWIDINNKAIAAYNQGVVNYSEITNVQNIVNEQIDDRRPTIDYDLQNYELSCNCLKDNKQLTFNLKLNCATSVYTRLYSDSIYFNNNFIGLNIDEGGFTAKQYNYLDSIESYLTPVMLQFSVNNVPSQTKVFDNQKIVLIGKTGEPVVADTSLYGNTALLYPRYLIDKLEKEANLYNPFMANKYFSFTTDYYNTEEQPKGYTDRENNICYAIPRVINSEYGDRLRGKWMKVDITDEEPDQSFAISHVITKVRQSYS